MRAGILDLHSTCKELQMGAPALAIQQFTALDDRECEARILAAKEKLGEYGVNESDIEVIEVPEGVPEGHIMVTVWPHYLSVAKVKRVREGSIYAPQLFNIQM